MVIRVEEAIAYSHTKYILGRLFSVVCLSRLPACLPAWSGAPTPPDWSAGLARESPYKVHRRALVTLHY